MKRKAVGSLAEDERLSERRGGIIIQREEGGGVGAGAEYRLTVHYL